MPSDQASSRSPTQHLDAATLLVKLTASKKVSPASSMIRLLEKWRWTVQCPKILADLYAVLVGTGVLPSLPIADMATGAVGALEVLLALRDRAKHGGSYHGSAVLVSANTVQLTQTFGLYSPEVVQKIQDTMKFAQMTPDLHVEDLLGVVLDGWRSQTNVFSRQEFFSKFANSPFGKDHTILGPVVKFENEASSPYWNHSPVPFCSHEKVGWGLDEKVV